MSKPANIILLCEDKQLAVFSRNFLKQRGLKPTEIERPHKTGDGLGGKQWVTQEYPRQLKAIRQRTGAVLIVCTDADKSTVERRITELDEACRKVGIEPRTADDPVLMIVPKWEIETWLSYLKGEYFDEDNKDNRPSSHYTGYEKECKEQVRKLVDMCYINQALREPAPSSLKAACIEYKKLKQYWQ